MPRARAAALRLIVIGLGLIAGLGLLEGLLQVAALVSPLVLARGGRSGPVAASDRMRILCIGDSHVYGAMVAPEEAYPERLEAALVHHGVPVQVVNLGIPGQNSRQVLERLPAALERYAPRVVLVWVGINNYWNIAGRDGAIVQRGLLWRTLSHFRLVRFVRLFTGAREGVAGDVHRPDTQMVEFTPGGETRWEQAGERIVMTRARDELTPDATAAVTRADLEAVVDTIRAGRAVPVLLGYPFGLTPGVRAVNGAIAAVAAEQGVPLIRTDEVAGRLAARSVHRINFPDMHPSATLYRAIAWTVARQLRRDRLVSARSPSASS